MKAIEVSDDDIVNLNVNGQLKNNNKKINSKVRFHRYV